MEETPTFRAWAQKEIRVCKPAQSSKRRIRLQGEDRLIDLEEEEFLVLSVRCTCTRDCNLGMKYGVRLILRSLRLRACRSRGHALKLYPLISFQRHDGCPSRRRLTCLTLLATRSVVICPRNGIANCWWNDPGLPQITRGKALSELDSSRSGDPWFCTSQ